MGAIAWCHSSGVVLTAEKKQGEATMGRWGLVRGAYSNGMNILLVTRPSVSALLPASAFWALLGRDKSSPFGLGKETNLP